VTLRQRLGATPCQVFTSDVRLHVVARDAYFYPDVAVTFSAQDLDDDASNQSEFREAVLIAEVLSESTERLDRGEKFSVYQQIAGLQEYVLLSTRGRKVEVLRKQSSGEWIGSVYLAGALALESLGIETSVEALCDSVEFR
jgi:Uma2 family endonuclease